MENADPDDGQSDASSTSVETVYEVDPDYTGPIAQSQPCQKRGISYTPTGWKKTYQKRRKLNMDDYADNH